VKFVTMATPTMATGVIMTALKWRLALLAKEGG